jgi:hypothetical protein
VSYRAIFGLLIGAAFFVWVAMFTVAMATSGSAVSGFGNGGNRVYADPTRDELAELLVSTRSAPEVSDDALRRIHEAISRRAEAGELDAALVVLQVAALQRGDE